MKYSIQFQIDTQEEFTRNSLVAVFNSISNLYTRSIHLLEILWLQFNFINSIISNANEC